MRRVGVSERRACDQVAIGRGTYRYQCKDAADEPVLRGLIRELAQLRPRFGSPRLSALVRRELGPVNHKRVERIYAQEGLQLPRRRQGRRRGVGRLSETHGLPQSLVLNNGPEFTGKALETWARRMQVKLYFITPRKPAENGYIESFNGKFRD